MTLYLKHIAASTLVALAAGPFLATPGLAADTAAPAKATMAKRSTMNADESTLAASATDAVKAALGDDGMNVMATARGTAVTLVGWVNEYKQDSAARKAASAVPGVTKVYSKVHIWSSDNH